MALALNKNQIAIDGFSTSTEDVVNSVREYIEEHDCPDLSMDISRLNLIEASKVTILCSTYHWAKYPQGHLNLLIGSNEVRELVKSLHLGNVSLQTAK